MLLASVEARHTSTMHKMNRDSASHHISVGDVQPVAMENYGYELTERQLPSSVPHEVPAPDLHTRFRRPVPMRIVVKLVLIQGVAPVDS